MGWEGHRPIDLLHGGAGAPAVRMQRRTLPRIGNYEPLIELGSGGAANVWKARVLSGPAEGDMVVLKFLRAELTDKAWHVRLFEREAKLCSRLRHPNIIRVHRLERFEGLHFEVMDYVDGSNLAELFLRAVRAGSFFPTGVALYIALRICRALHYAHTVKGPSGAPMDLVHLDVSPANVLIGWDGCIKLIDFGLAFARLPDSDVPKQSTYRGKPSYMSPEQRQRGAVDARSDVYAMGVLLSELLVGRPLFKSGARDETRLKDVTALLNRFVHLPPRVVQVALKAMAEDPADRFQSAKAMGHSIVRCMRELGAEATRRPLGRFIRDLLDGPEQARPPERGALASQALVWSPTGSILGPISLSNLHGVARAQALGEGDMISQDGGDWFPVSDLGEVDASDERRSRGPTRVEVVSASQRGNGPGPAARADTLSPGDILSVLSELGRHRNGFSRVRFQRGSVRKELTVLRGKAIDIRSTQKWEIFGSFLVRVGAVHPAHLSGTALLDELTRQKLGELLVGRGLLRRSQLRELLTAHLREKLTELCSWTRGTVIALPPPEQAPGDAHVVDVLGHLAEGARRFTTSRQVADELDAVGRQAIHLSRRPPYPVERLDLPLRQTRLLERLEGRPRKLRAVLHADLVDPDELKDLRRLIHLLLKTGHLVLR